MLKLSAGNSNLEVSPSEFTNWLTQRFTDSIDPISEMTVAVALSHFDSMEHNHIHRDELVTFLWDNRGQILSIEE